MQPSCLNRVRSTLQTTPNVITRSLSVHQSQPHPHALIPPHYKALHGPMIPTASPYHIHQYHINARGWIKRCIEANSLQPLTNEPYLNKQPHSATTQPQPCLQHDSNRSKRHHHVTFNTPITSTPTTCTDTSSLQLPTGTLPRDTYPMQSHFIS